MIHTFNCCEKCGERFSGTFEKICKKCEEGKINMKERIIPITLNLTLKEMAELLEIVDIGEIQTTFLQELEDCEKLIAEEIVNKIDERTLITLYEYFEIADAIEGHFDFEEFRSKLEDAVRAKIKQNWD